MTELSVLLEDATIGVVTRDRNGRLAFAYDEDWRTSAGATPLSLSMPLAAREHAHAVVDPFLWGLLPDNERILESWAARFHVSARSAFSLLSHVGQDCAGAVRLVDPSLAVRRGRVDWIDRRAIGERLRALRADVSRWRDPDDAGQFSLAGAQPKTALLFDGKRWGVPSGRTPTTHILKPGIPGLEGHALNEHFCLSLASELGFAVARSTIETFDGETAIVVERYDRIRRGERLLRVHQEDLCQALAVHPTKKYENEGGPGVRAIVALLRETSSRFDLDLRAFVDSLALGWLIVATDGHAKNYSVLLSGRTVRLAPLYDVASAQPYHDRELRKLKLAMKIGGKYRVREIGKRQWMALERELGWSEGELLSVVSAMAKRLPDVARTVAVRMRKEGHAVDELADRIVARARVCASELG